MTYDTLASNESMQKTIAGSANADKVYPYDGFVVKLYPNGSALAYATYLGGSDIDEVLDLARSSSNFPRRIKLITTADASK